MNNEKITTYEPNDSLKKGYLNIFKEIISEIKDNRWLTWQLFKRNFLSTYKQSFLGLLWIVITPFASLVTFMLLHKAGIFNLGNIKVPYPIYAILGMAFWQVFVGALMACSTSISQAGIMITKINFSKKSLVFASIGKSIVAFSIQFLIVLVLFLIYGFKPSAGILLLPLLILPSLIFALGLGFIVALFNSFIFDVGKALSGLLGFLLFLTPILYARPVSFDFLAKLTNINPIYYLASMPREYILMGTISEWRGFIAAIAVAIIFFVIGIFIFHLTETRVTERL